MAQAQQQVRDMIRDLITAARRASKVRDDIPPDDLATYCINALTATHHLRSKAAVHRLVTITLAGLTATA